MIRQYLTYLLTALIALQSVAAVADVHQFHQSGTEHLAFEHEHDLADTESHKFSDETPTNSESTNPFDCHHCCHCHGMAHFYLGAIQESLMENKRTEQISNYWFVYLSHQSSPDTPPPINNKS
jgi:hypothetical protein